VRKATAQMEADVRCPARQHISWTKFLLSLRMASLGSGLSWPALVDQPTHDSCHVACRRPAARAAPGRRWWSLRWLPRDALSARNARAARRMVRCRRSDWGAIAGPERSTGSVPPRPPREREIKRTQEIGRNQLVRESRVLSGDWSQADDPFRRCVAGQGGYPAWTRLARISAPGRVSSNRALTFAIDCCSLNRRENFGGGAKWTQDVIN
jgi:hypothetical protein